MGIPYANKAEARARQQWAGRLQARKELLAPQDERQAAHVAAVVRMVLDDPDDGPAATEGWEHCREVLRREVSPGYLTDVQRAFSWLQAGAEGPLPSVFAAASHTNAWRLALPLHADAVAANPVIDGWVRRYLLGSIPGRRLAVMFLAAEIVGLDFVAVDEQRKRLRIWDLYYGDQSTRQRRELKAAFKATAKPALKAHGWETVSSETLLARAAVWVRWKIRHAGGRGALLEAVREYYAERLRDDEDAPAVRESSDPLYHKWVTWLKPYSEALRV